jgi:probable F420-dependent oxidoreductase
VCLPNFSDKASPQLLRSVAATAEELSYDTIWVADHVMPALDDPGPYASILEALTVLTWLAPQTERVRLGTSVLVLPQRHPVHVAKAVASLDLLSGGRVTLGVGVGWSAREFGYLNAEFEGRGTVMDESIKVLRSLWSGEGSPHAGPSFAMDGYAFAPLPVQVGGPPILMAGRTTRALERAVRLGDGWHGGATSAHPDDFRAVVERLRELGAPSTFEPTLRVRVGDQTSYREGPTGREFHAGGDPAELVAYFSELRDAGCTQVAISFWDGDPVQHLHRITEFAQEVMPAVAQPPTRATTKETEL